MDYCIFCMSELPASAETCPVCGHGRRAQLPLHHLRPGTVLQNRYLVGASIGEGGFGITYIGKDLRLERSVAIKEYYLTGYANRVNSVSARVEYGASEDRAALYKKGLDRFLQEARVLARFSGSPGIVDVLDFFEENGTAYIVMEYLRGQTLKARLHDTGPIPAEETVRLLLPVMRSLNEIHAQGLIHRDISPDNIMLTDGGIKLLDFGAARSMSAVANKSISVILKPGYAPEEQYRGKGTQGPWTDIYSLCATMYKCITGVTPDDAPERMRDDTLQPPSAMGIYIAPQTEYALMKGLAVRQEDRYRTVNELLDALLAPAPLAAPAPAKDNEFTALLFPAQAEPEEETAYMQPDDQTELLRAQTPAPAREPWESDPAFSAPKEPSSGTAAPRKNTKRGKTEAVDPALYRTVGITTFVMFLLVLAEYLLPSFLFLLIFSILTGFSVFIASLRLRKYHRKAGTVVFFAGLAYSVIWLVLFFLFFFM